MPRYFGLDRHKRYVHGCEWLVDEEKGRHFRFPNTQEGWTSFLRQVDGECWIALEVARNAFEAHDLLLPHVGQVLLANPVELKRLGSGRHTDRVDAERLAKMLALRTLPTVWVPPPAIRGIRRLVQYRDRLVRHRRRFLTQAKAVLRRHGLDGPRGTDPLRHLQPQEVEQVPEVDRILLLSALRQRRSVEAELQAIEAELGRRVAREPAVQLLLSVTGVGTVAAATLWAYLGDPTRFRTAKEVTGYAGLDASVHQSGEDQRHGRISRNGSSLLRAVLVEAAHSVARHDSGPPRGLLPAQAAADWASQGRGGPGAQAFGRSVADAPHRGSVPGNQARPPGAEAAAARQGAGGRLQLAGCASGAVAQPGSATEATQVRGVGCARA